MLEALRERHTGAYKYFLGFADNAGIITKLKWDKAVEPLKAGTAAATNGIFSKLDFNKKTNVYLLDVDNMLKARARKKVPRVTPESVLEQILTAFNIDEAFIETELEKRATSNMGVLHLDAFVKFFGEFPTHPSYYNLEDITALGETFVRGQDEVDLKAFSQRLTDCRRAKNMQRGGGFEGIHRGDLARLGS